MKLQGALIVGIAIVLIALLLPFGYAAVCDGHFPLTVVLADNGGIGTGSLYFADCWTDAEAAYALESGTNGEVPFHIAEKLQRNTYTLSVPWSGRLDCFGNEQSYHQPAWLVVQYSVSNPESAPQRKRFRIPDGRGPREIHISLP